MPTSVSISKQTLYSSLRPAKNRHASIQPLFEKARKLVQQHTGTDLSSITLNMATDSVIADEVRHETRRLVENQFSDPDFVNHFLENVMSRQSGTYAALYATRRSQVMVSMPLLRSYQRSLPDNPHTQQAAMTALLVHELVHAADDQRYNIHDNRDLDFRASFAQSAAFEGHAQWVTRNICAANGCTEGLDALDKFMFGRNTQANQLTQTVQAISRNVLEYSYIEGERFVAALANRTNGQALLAQMLSNPPRDPIQVLAPGNFPNTARDTMNNSLLDVTDSLDHQWAKAPWTGVATSPLKGVNLRSDPTRRAAAIDGFTRLITSMVALQLYDQQSPAKAPIEVTILTTESPETAQLFATTLHKNTFSPTAIPTSGKVRVVSNASGANAMDDIVINHLSTSDTQSSGTNYITLIAATDNKVVQVSGIGGSDSLFKDYANKVLATLQYQQLPQL